MRFPAPVNCIEQTVLLQQHVENEKLELQKSERGAVVLMLPGQKPRLLPRFDAGFAGIVGESGPAPSAFQHPGENQEFGLPQIELLHDLRLVAGRRSQFPHLAAQIAQVADRQADFAEPQPPVLAALSAERVVKLPAAAQVPPFKQKLEIAPLQIVRIGFHQLLRERPRPRPVRKPRNGPPARDEVNVEQFILAGEGTLPQHHTERIIQGPDHRFAAARVEVGPRLAVKRIIR